MLFKRAEEKINQLAATYRTLFTVADIVRRKATIYVGRKGEIKPPGKLAMIRVAPRANKSGGPVVGYLLKRVRSVHMIPAQKVLGRVKDWEDDLPRRGEPVSRGSPSHQYRMVGTTPT